MVHYYPLVVEACIEFKRFSRKYLADYNGKLQILARHFLNNIYGLK